MSVERVARMLEVKPATVVGWETGREHPEPAELELLAKMFDVSVEELHGTVENKTTKKAGAKADNSVSAPGDNLSGIGEGAKSPGDRSRVFGGEPEGRSDIWNSPLAAYLGENEKVLWAGQSTAEHVGGWMSGYERFFHVFMLAFALFWLAFAVNLSSIMGIFSLLFIGMWLYTAFGKYIVLSINKPNIYYAVTNMRVMLCITGRVNRFRDISYKRLSEARLILSRRGTGCGTIVFITPTHIPQYPYGRRYDRVANTNSLLDAFIDIADARRVYDLINAAKAEFEEYERHPF